MNENKKINLQIVVMVIVVIILIFFLLGIVLYVVYENKSLESNNIITTSITTTTKSIVYDEKTIVEKVMDEYLSSLKSSGKIDLFQYEVTLLAEEEYCPGNEYYFDKIYANVKINYKRLDDTFAITGNDDNTHTGSEDFFEATAIYIISKIDDKYLIEDLYTGC